MLQRICELPDGIDGLRAERKLTKRDCDEVFRPLLHDARRESRRVRLLYEFAPDFRGFTAGAAWEEARVGLNYLSQFERCAIVSDARTRAPRRSAGAAPGTSIRCARGRARLACSQNNSTPIASPDSRFRRSGR